MGIIQGRGASQELARPSAAGLRSKSWALPGSLNGALTLWLDDVDQLTFILWALSFCEGALEMFVSSNALDALLQQVTAAPREKVVRVALETLQV